MMNVICYCGFDCLWIRYNHLACYLEDLRKPFNNQQVEGFVRRISIGTYNPPLNKRVSSLFSKCFW